MQIFGTISDNLIIFGYMEIRKGRRMAYEFRNGYSGWYACDDRSLWFPACLLTVKMEATEKEKEFIFMIYPDLQGHTE